MEEFVAAHRSGATRHVGPHALRLGHVAHDDVPAPVVELDLAGGRARLLVLVLAVDDGGEAIAGVAVHALPHEQHRAAGGVDQDAADRLEPLQIGDRHPEGGDDDDVVRGNVPEVEFAVVAGEEQFDAHLLETQVHVRIVDDLADEVDALVGELVARLVGVVDRPVDPVAETEVLGQPYRDVAEPVGVGTGPDALDDRGVVLRVDQGLHLGLEAEALAEVGLLHGRIYIALRAGGILGRRPRPSMEQKSC